MLDYSEKYDISVTRDRLKHIVTNFKHSTVQFNYTTYVHKVNVHDKYIHVLQNRIKLTSYVLVTLLQIATTEHRLQHALNLVYVLSIR